ncbi:MAG: metalloregulator ArsR/SmtB family transcription factor [Treponema sp.]|nr:metalloregulator ArsR/SmtB family transcription factor [Treponema sp.]
MDEEHNHAEYFKIDFLRGELAKNDDFQTVADYFSILSDASRLKIFWLLCHSKECVNNIADYLKMTTPAVSHHLKLLRQKDLISSERDGKEVFYKITDTSKAHALHEIIEKLMAISCPDFDSSHEKINEKSEYLENQVATIKQVHDYLLKNISKRITIEELSKDFAMNPTTLKTIFKDVYGTSLAAHIKEHRMEKAAELLTQTEQSINQIATSVGYESQSKFCAVFKESFGMTPVKYRMNHGELSTTANNLWAEKKGAPK